MLVTNLWFWAPDCNFQNCWVFSTGELFFLSQLWPGSCAISHLKMPCPPLSRSVTIHLPLISLLHCSRFYIPHAHTHTGKFHSPYESLEPATHLMIFIHQFIVVNIKIARCAQCRGGDSHQSAQPAFKIPDIWHVRYWGFQLAIKFVLIAE